MHVRQELRNLSNLQTQMKILTSREHVYFPVAREEIFPSSPATHPTRLALGGIAATRQGNVSAASLFLSLCEHEVSSKNCVYLTQGFNRSQTDWAEFIAPNEAKVAGHETQK